MKVALVIYAGYDANHGIVIQGLARIVEKGREFREIYDIFHKRFNWVRGSAWKEGEAPFVRIDPVHKAVWGPGLE
ncbi:MAG TPA: hypothetical protein VLV18_03640 [Terriglobales bacterium]|nr:hypothetical protein [Terriglobales bacterium]